MRFIILGGIILLCAITAAQAKVYKWTDTQGRVHYSGSPPPTGQASEIPIAPASEQSADRPAAGAAAVDDANARGEAADAARPDDALRQNCEIAKQNLTTLQNPAIRRFREDGKEPVYYTDEQRQVKIEETEKMVAAFCKDGADQ